MKVVVTGGHHTAALAVIEKYKFIDKKAQIYWIGHKFSMENDKNVSAEFKDVTESDIPFYDINAGKFYNSLGFGRFLRILNGIKNAYELLKRLKPDGVISFGGYIAFPVAVSARLLKIPVVTHEQTVVAGWSNRVIARFAEKVFVSFKSSEKYFPKQKVVFTGLPLRKEVFLNRDDEFSFENGLPIVYVTGGKQGSHLINDALRPALPRILEFANVVHQCGGSSVYNDFAILTEFKKGLSNELAKRYLVFDYIKPSIIGSVLGKAGLVVTRGGANSIYELISVEKPALVIPLQGVSHNEQEQNAAFFKSCGLGEILYQKDLSPDNLTGGIINMLKEPERYKLNTDKPSLVRLDSAEIVAYEAYKIFSDHNRSPQTP